MDPGADERCRDPWRRSFGRRSGRRETLAEIERLRRARSPGFLVGVVRSTIEDARNGLPGSETGSTSRRPSPRPSRS
jgi:hypothetical protein